MKVKQAVIDDLQFHMMPQSAGQIVEVSYAADEDGLWCRTYDRSDNSVWYEFALYYSRSKESELAFEPQNGRLPRHNQFQPVTVV